VTKLLKEFARWRQRKENAKSGKRKQKVQLIPFADHDIRDTHVTFTSIRMAIQAIVMIKRINRPLSLLQIEVAVCTFYGIQGAAIWCVSNLCVSTLSRDPKDKLRFCYEISLGRLADSVYKEEVGSKNNQAP
jgi:hypothetical protein